MSTSKTEAKAQFDNPFKPGDEVRCIDTDNIMVKYSPLAVGEHYIVLDSDQWWVEVDGSYDVWDYSRFEYIGRASGWVDGANSLDRREK